MTILDSKQQAATITSVPLPPSLWDTTPTPTLNQFSSRLKTHLFGLAYGPTLRTAVRAVSYKRCI